MTITHRFGIESLKAVRVIVARRVIRTRLLPGRPGRPRSGRLGSLRSSTAYNVLVRRFLIVGLIVLAALLPLALPVTIFVLDVPFVVADAATFVGADAQPVALLALTLSRAPPSR